MAGVSDAAYRTMARAGGAGLAYTEMVSCAGLHYGGEKTWELVEPAETEPDIAVQLFGSKPELFREAATSVLERLGNRLALIDINMACPVPKVTKKGEGSALLDNPELAASLVRACIEGSGAQVPVTVKIRRGRRMGEEVAPEFARAMEAAGASAIAVHGRFANQLYHGEADWGVREPRGQGGKRAGHWVWRRLVCPGGGSHACRDRRLGRHDCPRELWEPLDLPGCGCPALGEEARAA